MDLQNLCLAILFSISAVAAAVVEVPAANPFGCQRECGNISVPYPFGLGDSSECYKDPSFQLSCNYSTTPPTLLTGSLKVLNISVETATTIVELHVAYTCYNESGVSIRYRPMMTLTEAFTLSTRNKFFGIGCDTLAYFSDNKEEKFITGCISECSSNNILNLSDPINFAEELISCSGMGCCQTPAPKHLRRVYRYLDSRHQHKTQLDTNPCSFAFFADPTWYNNSANFTLKDTPEKHPYSPVVLDWSIGNITCEDAKSSSDPKQYICGPNTNCMDSTNGAGYLCSCKDGFIGNSYTSLGCIDVDECLPENKLNYPCKGMCKNTLGNYTCECSFGYDGDGKVGCRLKTITKVLSVIAASCLLAILFLSLLLLYTKKTRERNQQKNGGWLLQRLDVKVYKEVELKTATNNFQRLLGEGGNGFVYKGSLLRENTNSEWAAEKVEVAVKRSKMVDEKQIEQFLNEVDVVSKVNHTNVVKLLGVCLETKVPMLVYEFVPNGTLSDHIHGELSGLGVLYSWPMCLNIATATAQALHYMHSQCRPPIIHRDVKSANILLDANYVAKVTDFGASKLIPPNRTIPQTEGQGTLGYLDPEYVQTGELNEKSDVYGFGVVLMELLIKKKPISRGESNGEIISLVMLFTSAVEDDKLGQLLKVGNLNEHEMEQVHIVAELAVKCVAMSSKNRPSMTEVADELNGMYKECRVTPVQGIGEEVASDDHVFVTPSGNFEIYV